MTTTNNVPVAPTSAFSDGELRGLHRMLETSYEEAFVEDWDHALGGMHFLVEDDAGPVAHASVVERLLEVDGRPLRTGYVEAVATRPDQRRRAFGAQVVSSASNHIRDRYEMGALGTGEFAFYTRLGWERWRGKTFVRTPQGLRRTPDEDGYIMILRTARTGDLDLDAPLSCDLRPGDVWRINRGGSGSRRRRRPRGSPRPRRPTPNPPSDSRRNGRG